MIRSIAIISLGTSIFLFQLGTLWVALVPLLVSMYLIFTDGRIEKTKKDRWFSKYHILFGLWCAIIIGLTLLLHTLNIWMITILLIVLGFHVVLIWLTLLWGYKDEFTMFHIGYYFIAFLIARFVPIQYGLQNGIIAWLLFPILTFLLYMWGSFFINPFVPLPAQRHYRTGIFFVISFLSSTILYFFSAPLIWWMSGLLFYTVIVRFYAHQYIGYITSEKNAKVDAEDILAGKNVIQPKDTRKHDFQEIIYKTAGNLPISWRLPLVLWWTVFLLGVFGSAFSHTNSIWASITLFILCFAVVLYYDSLRQWQKVAYPTTQWLSIIGACVHFIFLWTVWKYIGFSNLTASVFLTMGWTIIHQWLAIFLWWQAIYRNNSKKYPLLYGYVVSTVLLALGVSLFLNQVLQIPSFSTGVILLYLGIIGTMTYFFMRTFSPKTIG